MRTLILSAISLLLWCPVSGQEDVREIPDKEAKELVKQFRATMKENKKNLRARIEAVQKLALYRNSALVKPLQSTAQRDTAKAVRQEACLAIGSQPPKSARRALAALLKKADIKDDPGVTACIIRAINRSCYDRRDWAGFEKMFRKVLLEKDVAAAQIAILECAGDQREVQALDFLVEHIDPPEPAWVDDPNNPPAEYWEARHKNWAKWKSQVSTALFKVTGQRFGSAKEAKVWLEKNRKELEKEIRKEKEQKEKEEAKKDS